jgi:hypothetical protein
MEAIKLEITDNAIQMLHSDVLDLTEFGEVKVVRASNVEFDNQTQAWTVTSAKTGKLLKGDCHTREEALKWEKNYYSPDGEGWEELTMDKEIESCPYCGFEIGTDDCTCGGLMNILPGSESRMDYLLTKI